MSSPVRIPVDIDVEDRLVGPLSARQLVVLAAGGLPLWLLWSVRDQIGVLGFAVAAVPITVLALVFAFARLDGIGVDRLTVAAAHQRLTHPRLRTERPDPADPGAFAQADRSAEVAEVAGLRAVRPVGPVLGVHPAAGGGDLAVLEIAAPGSRRTEALAVIAEVTPVNLALRNPGEQEALIAGFARWLHALSGHAQILTRTHRVDLRAHLEHLHRSAQALPPALGAAARDHAAHLAHRAEHVDLLERRTYIVLTETTAHTRAHRPRGQGALTVDVQALEQRLRRRLSETHDVLGAAGITLTPLSTARADDVVRDAVTGHHRPPSPSSAPGGSHDDPGTGAPGIDGPGIDGPGIDPKTAPLPPLGLPPGPPFGRAHGTRYATPPSPGTGATGPGVGVGVVPALTGGDLGWRSR